MGQATFDSNRFTLVTGTASIETTEGASVYAADMRLRKIGVSVTGGEGPVHVVIWVRMREGNQGLRAGWVRGNTDIGAAGAIWWFGEVVTVRNSRVWIQARNDSGADATVRWSYMGEQL